MSVWEAAFLGLVQGLTEFLPISSSGHLVLLQQLMGLGSTESILTFDVAIHMATLIAIIVFFGWSLLQVRFKEWLIVGVGTIPAVLIGLLFKDQIESLFANDIFLGLEFIATGLLMLATDWKLEQKKADENPISSLGELSYKQAFLIGLAQAVAIIPGISRSGSTVAAGIFLGIERQVAFRFSFLLALPALAGAGILEAKDLIGSPALQSLDPVAYGAWMVMALLSGLASLALFRYVIRTARLEIFGWYCIVLGVMSFFIL